MVTTFVLGHMTVYILSAFDDIKWKHQCRFDKEHTSPVRLALVFRWLGRRTKFFERDYKGERQAMELIPFPNSALSEKFPWSEQCRQNFGVTRTGQRERQPLNPKKVVARAKQATAKHSAKHS